MQSAQLALQPHPTAATVAPIATPHVPPAPPRPADGTQARLERLGSSVARYAAARDVAIEFLGVEDLFDKTRLYAESTSPWAVCPAAKDPLVKAGLPIPARQRRQLQRIVEAGMDFPALYLAHELGQKSQPSPVQPRFDTYRTLTDKEAQQLIVRPLAPAGTVKTASRIDKATRNVNRGLLGLAIGVGAIGVGAAGAAIALGVGAAAAGLDPAVLGVLTEPGAGYKPGTPAAWFLLARWDW